jgi:hypothetical protein
MESMELPLAGRTVQAVQRSGYQLLLEFSGGYQLYVEVTCTVTTAGRSVQLDPADLGAELGADVLALVGQTVRTATTTGGALHVEFAGGLRIEVPADRRYEAWQLVGPDAYRVICIPGGDLAVWSGQGQ